MKDPVAVISQITHPDEGPCPLCSYIFDTHKDGCPYEAIDAALAVPLEQGGWISVKDRLPPEAESVIAWGRLSCDTEFSAHEAFVFNGGWDSVRENETITVTHWQPLPSPPKEDV